VRRKQKTPDEEVFAGAIVAEIVPPVASSILSVTLSPDPQDCQ